MMSDILNQACAMLTDRLGPDGFDGSAKFEIEDVGAIMIDAGGVRVADEEADVTLSADVDTFQSILAGDTNPTAAFMTGKLKVDGDMGMAMKLGGVLG